MSDDYSESTRPFAAWLIEQRETAGLSQSEMVRRAQIDRSHYHRLESIAKGGPADPRYRFKRAPTFYPVLEELSRVHQRDLVTEGLRLWVTRSRQPGIARRRRPTCGIWRPPRPAEPRSW